MADVSPWLLVSLLLGLGLWAWLLRGGHGRVAAVEWRAGDSVCAALLGAYFLLVIVSGGRGEEPLTLEAIHAGILFYAVVSTALLMFLSSRGISPRDAFGLRFTPGLTRALGVGVLAIAATYPIVLASEQVARFFDRSVSDGDGLVQFLTGPLTPGARATVALLAVVVAPFTEELVFRGFLYGVLRRSFGSISAMTATALLFAAIHLNLPAMPAYFLLAVGLTLAYERTGSLWTPILMHALFNATSLVIVLYFPQWIPNV